MDLRDLPPLAPATCFDVQAKLSREPKLSLEMPFKKSLQLGSMSHLIDEEQFATVGVAASKDGLLIFVDVEKPFDDCHFPYVSRGDGMELFIDTRGLKETASIHKYCHHFVILPKGESHEVTRFRMEDSHPLASSEQIQVRTKFEKRSYQMKILLPKEILYGFDLDESPSLGFEFIVHRTKGPPQHHTLSSRRFKIASHPNLWSTLSAQLRPKI